MRITRNPQGVALSEIKRTDPEAFRFSPSIGFFYEKQGCILLAPISAASVKLSDTLKESGAASNFQDTDTFLPQDQFDHRNVLHRRANLMGELRRTEP